MVSEYKYLLSEDLQIEMTGHAWGHPYEKRYHNGLYDYPECTKKGLNHFVQRVLALYTSVDPYIDDCHHFPQVAYIWDPDGTRQCSDIIRAEDLPQAFNAVMEREGY